MQDFVVQCCVKDYTLRLNTDQLARHDFVKNLPNERQVRAQIKEQIDRKKNKGRRGTFTTPLTDAAYTLIKANTSFIIP